MENLELVRNQKLNTFLPTSTLKNYSQVGQKAYFNTIQPTAELAKFSKTSKPKKKRTLSQRLDSYYQTKKTLGFLYAELGNYKKAERISRCNRFVELTLCENGHIANKKVNFRCEHRLCPECDSRRAYEKIKEFEPIVEAFLEYRPELSAIHLILTQLQKPNETLKQARKRLIKAVKKLIGRKFWTDNFAGSLNGYEFTISYRTYKNGAVHFHLHLMAFCKIPASERSKQWLKEFHRVWSAVSNGENKNLKIVPVTDVKSGLRELIKYVCAPSDIQKFTVEHLAEVEELHRVKMTSTFGDFNKFVTAFRAEEPEQPEKEPETQKEELELSETPKEEPKLSETQKEELKLREFITAYRAAHKQPDKEPQTPKEELKEGDSCPKCQMPLFTTRKPIETIIIELRELERKMEMRL
jgi:plasmid rolling circle replication initiator protein Rep